MTAAAKPASKTEYRIDDLARAAKTTVRNVRSYQEKGLLPPPRRDGRVAIYGEAHLARLRLINGLLERGYSLGNIAELVEGWESGQDLRALLGFEAAITNPFSAESPTTITLVELAKRFGTGNLGALSQAVASGMLEVHGDEFRVPSERLLAVGVELHRAGVPLSAIFSELKTLRRDLDKLASRFVELVTTHVFAPHLDAPLSGAEAKRLTDLVHKLRPLAEVAVSAELARALDHQVPAHLGEQMGRMVERGKGKR